MVDKPNDDKPKDTGDMKASDVSSPYYLHPSDHPGMNICQVVLKGENFQEWERCMRNAFPAKRKLGFLDGIITKPDDKSLEIEDWWSVNSMLLVWLFNSIEPNLRSSISYFDTNGQSISTYYGKLKKLWDELSMYVSTKGCTCGKYDDLYGNIRTNIITQDPLPPLNRACALVIQEERNKNMTKGKEGRSEAVVMTYLLAFNLKVTPTGGLDHVEKTQMDVVVVPHPLAVEIDRSSLTPALMSHEKLSGMSLFLWILGTGASLHMTGDKSVLHDLHDIFPIPVCLPDGVLANAVHEGTIVFNDGLRVQNDRISRTVIGVGEERNGVFWLQSSPSKVGHWAANISNFDTPTSSSISPSSYNDNIASSDDSDEWGSDIVNETNDVGYATNESQENTSGPRRSSRERQPSVLLRDFFSTAHAQFLAAVTMGNEPTYFSQADPNWRDTMHKEIDALEKNGTWVLEDLPHGKKAIGCKWVYKIKYHSDGTIERYNARLVILGNNQVAGIDYNETFAPVAKMVSVRVFLAIAVIRNLELHQMDVHNAFLHGDLDEEVYMKLPPGFYGSCGKVCRLKKSLYGPPSSETSSWFLNSSLLLKLLDSLSRNNSDAITKFKAYTSACFHMKDLGALKYFLGIEIARHPEGLFLSQRKYALDILSESGLLGAKPCDFPIEPNHQLALASGPDFNQPDRYRRLCPKDAHWNAALRVLHYLKGHPGQGLCFDEIAGYNLTHTTMKQPTVSRSSAEAEYRSMATTRCEFTWLKSLLIISLGVHGSRPMRLFCNNTAAIHIASNPVFHDRTKHIEVDCYYVREQIQAGNIVTSHVSTDEQPADILTKALGKRPFQYLLCKLGVRDLHTPT
ncbi:retrovirus-related pol polyprotein from transposon TNT 1-94 [Tanacetum coccineum]